MEVAVSFVTEELNALLHGEGRVDWFAANSTAELTFVDRSDVFTGDSIRDFTSQLADILHGKVVRVSSLNAQEGRYVTVTLDGELVGQTTQQRFRNLVRLDRTSADEYFVHGESWTFFAAESIEVATEEVAAAVVAEETTPATAPVESAMTVPPVTVSEPQEERVSSKPPLQTASTAAPAAAPAPSAKDTPKPTGWAGVAARPPAKVSNGAPTRVVAGPEKPQAQPEPVAEKPKPKTSKPEKAKIESCTVLKVATDTDVSDDHILHALPAEIQSSVIRMRNNAKTMGLIFIDFSVSDSFDVLSKSGVVINGKNATVERPRAPK